MADHNAFLIAAIDSAQAFEYDDLYQELAEPGEETGEKFDLFVRLSYHLSQLPLSPSQIERASVKIVNLAVSVLTFNFCQGDTDETSIASSERGYQTEAA